MLSSIVLCVVSASWYAGDLPRYKPAPLLPVPGEDAHTKYLKVIRALRAANEGQVKAYEEVLTGPLAWYSKKEIDDLRRGLAESRADLERAKKVERELQFWERERKSNPFLETEDEMWDRIRRLGDELRPPPT